MKRTLLFALCLAFLSHSHALPVAGVSTNRITASSIIRPTANYRVYSVDPKNTQAVSTSVVSGTEALKRVNVSSAVVGTTATSRMRAMRVLTPNTAEATNTSTLSSSKAAMPSIIIVPNATNDVETPAELFVFAETVPLRWDTNLNAYSTPVLIGVDVPDAAHLPRPLTFQMIGENCTIVPSRVTVTNGGTGGAQTAILKCVNPRSDPTIFAFYDPSLPRKPLRVPCLRELGDIVVEAEQESVFGYGLGTTKVTVSRLARDRDELFGPEDLNVTVTTKRGILGKSLTISSNQSAGLIEFRSVGIGRTIVSARVGSFTDSKEIECTFPLSLIVGTILGGGLGGFGRLFRNQHLFKHKYRIILEGALCGVLIFAAAAAGVVVFTLPTGVIGSELGAFVIAAMAGYTGSVVLDRFKTAAKPKLEAVEV
jgi:hypothetical protein